jgi:hypothetical protein
VLQNKIVMIQFNLSPPPSAFPTDSIALSSSATVKRNSKQNVTIPNLTIDNHSTSLLKCQVVTIR